MFFDIKKLDSKWNHSSKEEVLVDQPLSFSLNKIKNQYFLLKESINTATPEKESFLTFFEIIEDEIENYSETKNPKDLLNLLDDLEDLLDSQLFF